MQITTTEKIIGQKILETKAAIFSEQVRSVNLLKDALSGLKSMFGGKSSAYEQEYRLGREGAIQELEAQAHRLGGNGIVGLRLNYSQLINSDIMLIVVTASGTVVKLER